MSYQIPSDEEIIAMIAVEDFQSQEFKDLFSEFQRDLIAQATADRKRQADYLAWQKSRNFLYKCP